MIKVDRATVPAPEFLNGPEVERASELTAAYYTLFQAKRRQTNFVFPETYKARPVLEALFLLFEGKCAFCETLLAEDRFASAAHYRPAEGAIDRGGNIDPDHYWWLAFEWNNLYPACFECIRAKGLRFPVEGPRAPLRTSYAVVVASERPVLLDPCRDEPEDHLQFLHDGRVVGKTERGRATIEILALNRESLVQDRAMAAAEYRSYLYDREGAHSTTTSSGSALLNRPESFVALRKALRAEWFAATAMVETHWIVEQRDHDRHIEQFSVAEPDARYYARSRMIDRIVLENFKTFSHLDLTFASKSETAPWSMFLGENGRGKTAILQAIALALLDEHQREYQKVRPATVLRNGTKSGSVKLWLTGREDPVELTYRADDDRFWSSEKSPKVLLLAYGATRLPRPEKGDETWARVENLFNPFAPLIHPASWFHELQDERLNVAVRVVKALLNLPDHARIETGPGTARIVTESRAERFDQLSDGYQSVLALGVDIMSVLFRGWSDMKPAEGLVLLDEIESHLHPSWKLRIVSSLRRSFPRVQFIATTHEPLCLRGLMSGEIVVLRQDLQGDIFAVTDLPDVETMTIDQLLTSEHFDLSSTVDPNFELQFRRYYELLAKRELTPQESAERVQLKDWIDKMTILGGNRRENVHLEIVDEFLAKERATADPQERSQLRDEARQRLSEIWSSVRTRGSS